MRALILASLLASPLAYAAPGFVPVQGLLTDSGGTVVDGSVEVTFTLYTDATGATQVWTDTMLVDVVVGRFAAELGAGLQLELDVFKNYGGLHLGITVAGDSEMPLVPLDHVPYAAYAPHAGDAGTLGGSTRGEIEALIPAASDLLQAARDAAFDTEAELTALLDDNYLAASSVPDWSVITSIPADIADGDDGFATEVELTTLLDDNYLAASYTPAWADLTGVPADIADGDDGFTTEAELTGLLNDNYSVSAGTGIAVSAANVISADQTQIETWATDAVASSGIPLASGGSMTFEVYTVTHNWNPTTSQDFYNIVAEDGTTDSLIVETMALGAVEVSSGGRIAYRKSTPPTESQLYIRLGSNTACWLAHQDDDNIAADAGLRFITELNSAAPWGVTAPSAVFARTGFGADEALQRYATYKIICIP